MCSETGNTWSPYPGIQPESLIISSIFNYPVSPLIVASLATVACHHYGQFSGGSLHIAWPISDLQKYLKDKPAKAAQKR